MEVLLLDTKKITKLVLPSKVEGVYTLRCTPFNSCYGKDIYIEALDGKWILKSNPMVKFYVNKKDSDKIELKEKMIIEISLYDSSEILYLYCVPNLNKDYIRYLTNFEKIKFGSTNQCSVLIKNLKDEAVVCDIYKENDLWYLCNGNAKINVYVNNRILDKDYLLQYGDLIFIDGLRIIWMKDFIQLNGLNSNFELDSDIFVKYEDDYDNTLFDENVEQPIIKKGVPTFKDVTIKKENIETEVINILLPPDIDKSNDNTFIILGISFMMVAFSLISFCYLTSIIKTNSGFSNVIIFLVVFLLLVLALILPFGYCFYRKKKMERKEEERKNDYIAYLNECSKKIEEVILKQQNILSSNYPLITDSYIKDGNVMWCRKISDDDFLNLRFGIGDKKAFINVSALDDSFTFTNDILLEKMYKIIDQKYFLKNVPILCNFTKNSVISLNIKNDNKTKILDLLIKQIVTLHNPNNLKLSFFLKNDEIDSYVKLLPHVFSNDRMIRYYAIEDEEMKVVADQLGDVFDSRTNTILNNFELFDKLPSSKKYSYFESYYLIFVDDINIMNNFDIFEKIVSAKENIGFSIVYVGDRSIETSNCSVNILDAAYILDKKSGLKTCFVPDFIDDYNSKELVKILLEKADFSNQKYNSLPTPLSFLKLFDSLYIEQLNILERWKSNDASVKLSTFVGEKKNKLKFILDTSDNTHGPHGLVIGDASSGKTEFLMTFILSMSINYNPSQIQFIILEKNDGKLYSSLSEGKYTIPHLLKAYNEFDLIDYKLILNSISEELKYREKKFADAIDVTNDVAMDIYKYQKYYRNNRLNESLSHLYFIIDDLDELTKEYPTFITELMSIIRVGHLFGIHLIVSFKDEEKMMSLNLFDSLFFKLKLDTRVNSLSFKDIGIFQLYSKNKKVPETGQFAYTNVKYDPYYVRQSKENNSILFIDNVGRIIESSDDCLKKVNKKVVTDERTVITKTLIDWSKNNVYNPRKLGKSKKKGAKKNE